MYISLHNHSEFSVFDGYSKVEEIVSRAKELGQDSISLTEHSTLSSIVPFYKECKKQGIKPILGNEFYFTNDLNLKDRSYTYHLILLAKTDEGYYNLKKLDTLSYENVYYKPRIDFNMLREHSKGLVCLSACLASIINTLDGEQWAVKFKDLFGDDFYLEYQTNTMQEQDTYNKKIIALSEKYNIETVITSDSHYAVKSDSKWHKYWVSIQKENNEYYSTPDYWIYGESDIYKIMQGRVEKETLRKSIENTKKIADQCNVSIKVEGNHFAKFPTDNELEDVKEICRDGWRNKIKDKIPKEEQKKYLDRFLHEMNVLEKCKYLNYLLIIHDISKWCNENNILVGPGRGSSGSSLVCYLMDITKLDPLLFPEMMFERFCNPDRITPCDIDLDFEDTKRQDVIDYVKEKYGTVYNIRVFSFMGIKGSLKRAGKSLNIPSEDVLNLTKGISFFEDIKGNTELVELAKHYEGRLQGYSVHASAVCVFTEDPLLFNPIERQKRTGEDELVSVCSYDYHDLEEMGILKLDILGLRNLSIVHNTLDLIGKPINIYNLPINDSEVYARYASGKTLGMFQVESSLMTHYSKLIKTNCFDDISALISLCRPGPLDSGMADFFVEGKNGNIKEAICPEVEPILRSTYQVLVYQEQLMKIVIKLGNYTFGEADGLRKIVGRKELDKINEATEIFISKAVGNGISLEAAIELGRQIKACGRYIFNASHGLLYAYMSYMTAWFLTHYNKEYMCSVLNSFINKQDKSLPYITEYKDVILSPDILKGNEKWCLEDDKIRVGLTYIKGVGANLDLSDISNLEKIYLNNNKKVLEALVKSGALDSFGERPYLLALVPAALDYQKKYKNIITKLEEWKYKNNQKKIDEWQNKLYNLKIDEVEPIKIYNYASTELETLGYTSYALPKIIKGKLIIYKELVSKKGNKYGKLTFGTDYGKIELTIFDRDIKKYKPRVNTSYMFMSNNDLLSDMKEVKE